MTEKGSLDATFCLVHADMLIHSKGKLLNVLMTASSYPASDLDWRGRFIYEMAESIASSHLAQLRLWAPPGNLPSGVASVLAQDDGVWLERLLMQGGVAHLLRRHPINGGLHAFGLLRRLRRVYRDFSSLDLSDAVVHANWIQMALPLQGTKLPALITVLGSDLPLLRLPGMVSLIRVMLRERAAILAPNADWMVPVLESNFGDLAEIRPIVFGVHARWFEVERKLNGGSEWLMVSRVTRAKMGHLLDWGQGIFGGKRTLHLLGPMQENIDLPDWIEYHGATNPDALADEWFPKVDGLISLSNHHEGRPQVMIEAMAAGMPVIASDLPAHRDLVRHGENGLLVGDRDSLRISLEQLDNSEVNRSMGKAGRHLVAECIGTWDDCARRYVDAYDDLLERV